MALPVRTLRHSVLPPVQPAPTARDFVQYAALAGLSLTIVVAPLAALTALFIANG